MSSFSHPTEDDVPSQSKSSKRKKRTNLKAGDSPTAPSHSENSNYSDTSNITFSHQSNNSSRYKTPDANTRISDEEDDYAEAEEADNQTKAQKKEFHRIIEEKRRKTEAKHLSELSSLVTNWYDSNLTKLPQLTLLKVAADLLDKINLRHQYDPLRPSHLTSDEFNFLNLEASNTFLFVTTMEPSVFRIIHVTDSIYRTLDSTPEQWLGQDLFSFVHPDDLVRVQHQLISLIQGSDVKTSIKCRLKQGNGSYSLVIIDGMPKKIDQSFKPVLANESGYFAFIGICHLPLVSKYNKTNMSLYKNPKASIFCCRCSPNDWKIFLVDRSISTYPLLSTDLFIKRSILDFIHFDERAYVHQVLLHASTTSTKEIITCHFIDPVSNILTTMILEIKPFLHPISKQTDFIELVFEDILNLMKDTDENGKLLEPDLLSSEEMNIHTIPPTDTGLDFLLN
jgi:hypothetical protein